jgi:hypothetical protein
MTEEDPLVEENPMTGPEKYKPKQDFRKMNLESISNRYRENEEKLKDTTLTNVQKQLLLAKNIDLKDEFKKLKKDYMNKTVRTGDPQRITDGGRKKRKSRKTRKQKKSRKHRK